MAALESYKEFAAAELVIDEHDLDTEALRTPRLHTRWLDLLSQSAIQLRSIQNMQKKLYIERWKYYSGTASDKYYTDYGVFHHKILKTDINIYLDSDDILCTIKEIIEIHEQTLAFCERTVKEISSRTFHIRAAIDWRKFASGG
jgi:hypothetical protein